MKLGKYVAMSDKLTGEYKKAFDYIDSYGESHMVGGSYRNEKMMDLLDILLTAQQEETDVRRIVGADWGQFSKDFFSDLTFVDLAEPFFSKICFWAWLVLVFEVLMILSGINDADFNLFTLKTDISGYAEGVIIAYGGILLADLVSIVLARRNRYSRKAYIIMVISFTLIALGAAIWLGINGYKIAVRALPVIIAAIAFLVIYYFCKLYYRYVKTGTLKKRKSEYDTTFVGLVKEEMGQIDYSKEPSVLKAYSRRYQKINKKREGKGLKPLTTKEFLEKQEKENRYATLIGLAVGILACFCGTLFSGGFESVFDALIYVLLICAACVIVYFVFIKSVNKIAGSENANILKRCEETGLEIDELYQRYQELSKNKGR